MKAPGFHKNGRQLQPNTFDWLQPGTYCVVFINDQGRYVPYVRDAHGNEHQERAYKARQSGVRNAYRLAWNAGIVRNRAVISIWHSINQIPGIMSTDVIAQAREVAEGRWQAGEPLNDVLAALPEIIEQIA